MADQAPSFRITRVKAQVYRAPRPLPKLGSTAMIGKPDLRKRNGWRWSTTRNGQPLTGEERAAYQRGELLVILVPEPIADLSMDDLIAILHPVENNAPLPWGL